MSHFSKVAGHLAGCWPFLYWQKAQKIFIDSQAQGAPVWDGQDATRLGVKRCAH